MTSFFLSHPYQNKFQTMPAKSPWNTLELLYRPFPHTPSPPKQLIWKDIIPASESRIVLSSQFFTTKHNNLVLRGEWEIVKQGKISRGVPRLLNTFGSTTMPADACQKSRNSSVQARDRYFLNMSDSYGGKWDRDDNEILTKMLGSMNITTNKTIMFLKRILCICKDLPG